MQAKKTITLDCSAINHLTDDKESGVILAAIRTAYFVRLTATNIDEIIATPKKKRGRRDALLNTCGMLLSAGECIFPHHFVSDIVVKDYQRHGKSRWHPLSLRSRDYEDLIVKRDLVNALAVQQRNFAKRTQTKFALTFGGLGKKLEKLFQKGLLRPAAFVELLSILQVRGGAFWKIAAVFYKHGANRKPREATLRKFIAACPPFYAFVLSVVMAEYGYSVRSAKALGSYRAERSDLLSALYLPYCHIFVTDDKRQLRCLPEIAGVAWPTVEILRYSDFRKRFIP
jgi:hypothetical protein